MSSGQQTVAFIHGLGEGSTTWEHQIAALPGGFSGVAVEIPGLAPGDTADRFNLTDAAQGIVAQLDSQGIDRTHVVGLSLGAMLAFQIAADHPHRVSSLVLAAGQVKPPRLLMGLQNAVMRLLPAPLVAGDGVGKSQMLGVLRAVSDTDFTARLETISAPTLVLCGAKDRPNLPAARTLAAGIPGAELRIIEGAGHRVHVQRPVQFSEELNAFLLRHA
ncbi:MAG: alpha/beta fold hydrolase [Leucobacter sp.]